MAYSFTLNGDRYSCETLPGSAGIKFHNRTKNSPVGTFSPENDGHWHLLFSEHGAELLADLRLVGLHVDRIRRARFARVDYNSYVCRLPQLPCLPRGCIPGGDWPI